MVAAGSSAHAPRASVASSNVPVCCFLVYVVAAGSYKANYGSNPSNGLNGTEKFRWFWGEDTIVELQFYDGEPDLEPAETPSGHYAPVLYPRSGWTSSSAEYSSSDGTTTPTRCSKTYRNQRDPQLAYNESFITVDKVRGSYLPNVSKAYRTHKYVMEVAGGNTPGLTPCGRHSAVAVGLEPPDHDQSETPFGPFTYYVTLPPRNDLMHAKGAPDEFRVEYNVFPGFTDCDVAGICSDDNDAGQHTTTELSDFQMVFHWFPLAKLQDHINQLKQGAKH